MEIINLTNNTVRLIGPAGEVLEVFEPEGHLYMRYEELQRMNDHLPVYEVGHLGIEGLPAYEDDRAMFYIVPSPVAHELADERDDLLFPSSLVRKDGRVIGCRSLFAI